MASFADYVKDQVQLSQKVKIVDDIDDCCKIDSSEGELVTTMTNCSCTFTKSMKLPCRHIYFPTQHHKGLLEYTEDIYILGQRGGNRIIFGRPLCILCESFS